MMVCVFDGGTQFLERLIDVTHGLIAVSSEIMGRVLQVVLRLV